MFCKHEWVVLSETVTKSAVEIAASLGATSIKNASTDRKHILVVSCDKCGKLKRFVEDI